jgi:hypothetical protein
MAAAFKGAAEAFKGAAGAAAAFKEAAAAFRGAAGAATAFKGAATKRFQPRALKLVESGSPMPTPPCAPLTARM